MLKFTASILSVLFLIGCGKSQNPLDDLPERYQNGVRPGDNGGGPLTPIDFLQIDVEPALINFEEGTEGRFNVKGRTVDLDNTRFTLELIGLPAGASYDAATGDVVWTPANDFVAVDQLSEVLNIEARMVTTEAPIMTVSKFFNIWVHRVTERPEILSIAPQGFSELREGAVAEYVLRYRLEQGDRARLGFVASNSSNDLSPFVFQKGNPSPTNVADEWELKIGVNLQGKELTEERADFFFGVMVYSFDGIQTQPENVSVSVVTQVGPAVSSWNFAQVFNHSEPNKYSFHVYIPKAVHSASPAGQLAVSGLENACSSMSAQLSCVCLRQSNQSFYCTVSGTPTAADVGFHELEFNSRVDNPFDSSDFQQSTHRSVLEIL